MHAMAVPETHVIDKLLNHLMGGRVETASKTDWAGHPEKKTPGGSGETSATAEADKN